MSEFITHSREETVALGAQVAQHLAPGALIAFTGGLGAGKTAFCEGIARGLGCTDPVSSPTFAIVNEYRGEGIPPVYHFDFYRIDRIEEAFDFGYEEYFYGGDLCLVEWPEKIESLLPDDAMTVRIEVTGEDSRTIEIDPQD